MFQEAIYILIALLIPHASTYKVEVKVQQGNVIGVSAITVFKQKLYFAFYGVPYAKPPIGKLRFKNPKPIKKWMLPHDASIEFHGACSQAHITQNKHIYGIEDCLYLNIYTPEVLMTGEEKLKPIIVWVHGYAFTTSFSHIHGADFIIEKDVLLVTVSHRLGVLGFSIMNETAPDANMGLKDIVMALKWINKNIRKFGGDSTKVTLMGSGSGASFISLLLMTKHRRLLSGIILQSGTLFSPAIFQTDPTNERVKLQRKLNSSRLWEKPANEMVPTSVKLYKSKEVVDFQRPVVPFSPVVEPRSNSSLIHQKPDEFYEQTNKISKIPMLVGFNSQESIAEIIPFLRNPYFLTMFRSFFKFMVPFSDGCKHNSSSATYRKISDKIKKWYFKSDTISEKSIDQFVTYTTDLIKYPIYKFMKRHARLPDSRLFGYKFNYVGRFNVVRSNSLAGSEVHVKGASSGDEICYILKCEPAWSSYVDLRDNTTHRDRVFADEITTLWTNFAKYGEPTPASIGINYKWTPMTKEQNRVLLLGNEIKMIEPKLEEKMFSFWNEIYAEFYSPNNCENNIHDEL